jgi:hypothetical protein
MIFWGKMVKSLLLGQLKALRQQTSCLYLFGFILRIILGE